MSRRRYVYSQPDRNVLKEARLAFNGGSGQITLDQFCEMLLAGDRFSFERKKKFCIELVGETPDREINTTEDLLDYTLRALALQFKHSDDDALF